jgi:demethylmenaquinone methyltransferase/2-methoxy-6-polyprenyl-1,4-benzoquinol methylase
MSTSTQPEGSGAMFDRIAYRYDLLNRIISMGVDQRWRRKAVAALRCRLGGRYLDLATGTADLALQVAHLHPGATVDGVDPSENMLSFGRLKAVDRSLQGRVTLHVGDAQALDFPDDTFDGSIMGFGIRNVPDRARALREMARVVKPGGAVVILELNDPRDPGLIPSLARFHIHQVVPRLGGLVVGGAEYDYLQRSIAAFPSPDDFAQLMRDAGLTHVQTHPLTFGVATLFVGKAPATPPGA